MAQKDVGNKIPIYKLKTTDEIMKYYDTWGVKNQYDQDMIDWNYSGPKETVQVFKKYAKNKDIKIYDAGCGTGLVGVELKKFGYKYFDGADLSQKLLDLIPKELYQNLSKVDLNKNIEIKNYLKDHRIFMMSAIAALSFGGKWKIHNKDSIQTSLPSFLTIIKKLGGKIK